MGDGMRALKIVTIIMGVLIVLGTIGLLVALALRRPAPPVPASPAGFSAELNEPAGTRIAGIAAVQDRLAVQLQGGGVDRVLLIDPRTGAITGHIFATH